MKIEIGHLSLTSAVTTARSQAIDISRGEYFGAWFQTHGDFGQTGASCQVVWEASYTEEGAYSTPVGEAKLVSAGTSVGGYNSDGIYLKSFTPVYPFMKFKATHDSSAATCAAGVTYALVYR